MVKIEKSMWKKVRSFHDLKIGMTLKVRACVACGNTHVGIITRCVRVSLDTKILVTTPMCCNYDAPMAIREERLFFLETDLDSDAEKSDEIFPKRVKHERTR